MYTPKFIITNKILKNTGIIEAAREVIDHAPLLPYYEREFQKEALVRSVHYGTHIEGNELNLNQAEKVMEGEEILARDRDIQEVINYRKVIDYIGELSSQEDLKIDENLILKLHLLLKVNLIVVSVFFQQSPPHLSLQSVSKISNTSLTVSFGFRVSDFEFLASS